MTQELTLLGWTLVLALVQILLPSFLRTREIGSEYNASPRDGPSPVPIGQVTGRLQCAQQNLFETLPLFAAAILIAHVAGREGTLTLCGAHGCTSSRGSPMSPCTPLSFRSFVRWSGPWGWWGSF